MLQAKRIGPQRIKGRITLLLDMQINEIIQSLEYRKGSNLRVMWQKDMKVKKSAGDVKITKKTSIVARGGIEYDNMKVVQEGRADGSLPSENAGLPWGEWAQYPYHITHKGTDYARFYPASGLEFKPEVHYFMDGVEVSKEEIVDLCLASEFPKKDEEPLCFTVKAANVISIG